MKRHKIFVVNWAGHDISDAFNYTDLSREKAQVNLTEGNVNLFDVNRLTYSLKESIENSGSDDYLLLCGNTIINCIAFHLWLQLHGVVNLLLYNYKTKAYILRTLTSENMKLKEASND